MGVMPKFLTNSTGEEAATSLSNKPRHCIRKRLPRITTALIPRDRHQVNNNLWCKFFKLKWAYGESFDISADCYRMSLVTNCRFDWLPLSDHCSQIENVQILPATVAWTIVLVASIFISRQWLPRDFNRKRLLVKHPQILYRKSSPDSSQWDLHVKGCAPYSKHWYGNPLLDTPNDESSMILYIDYLYFIYRRIRFPCLLNWIDIVIFNLKLVFIGWLKM